jgi:predicted kinase
MASANSALPDVLDDAQHYLAQALTYLAPARPCLVAVGGLSGSGKSTLAARLAPTIGLSPGAIHVRSDLERKRLFGAAETERLPDEAYTRPVTEKVYAALNEMAAAVLATSHTVIVDAVHSAPHERAAVARIAEAAQVPFIGLWLDVPGRVLKDRVTARIDDASDATADVVARQLDYDLGDISWHRLDASGDLDALCERARDIIAASFGATTGKEPRP